MVRGKPATETPWQLIDIDGTRFPLHRSNVLGRKPSTAKTPEGTQAISLSDANKVLSRTHALIEIDEGKVWVTDLDSTNGTGLLESIDTADDDREECEPRVRTEIPPGVALSLGGRKVAFTGPQAHEQPHGSLP